MTSTPSIEEQPKRKIAKQVITPKRLWFSPEHGHSVEADSAEDAAAEFKKKKDEQDNGSK